MTLVYTGISLDNYHGKTLLELIESGLPKGAYGTTHPVIADYYRKTHYPKNGAIVVFDIPDVLQYSKITDRYDTKSLKAVSFMLVKKPPMQRFVGVYPSAEELI